MKTTSLRYCAACSAEHFERSEKVAAANPNWTVDQWAKYWEKDGERQLQRIWKHCDPIHNPHLYV